MSRSATGFPSSRAVVPNLARNSQAINPTAGNSPGEVCRAKQEPLLRAELPMSAPMPIVGMLPAALQQAHTQWSSTPTALDAADAPHASTRRPSSGAKPSGLPKLPVLPRKVKNKAAALPRAPKPVASTTAAQDVQRSRRDVKAPHRFSGISQLGHSMLELEAYTHGAGESGSDSQPFEVLVHPRALAAMDVHAHLCMNEVIGVFGGYFDARAACIHVDRAIAVQEGVLPAGKIDVEMDAADQSRAIEELRHKGLQCVGWYHSHPTFPVLPSAIDVYNQHTQQVAHSQSSTASSGATPYIAAIVGPYAPHPGGAQSQMAWFYVENRRASAFSLEQAPEACLQHMVPKLLSVDVPEDAALTVAEVLTDAEPLLQRYRQHPHRADFAGEWQGGMTRLQKMVSSVMHDVRCYFETDALRDLGVQLLKLGWRWFLENPEGGRLRL
jgi:proteasome lid subunit RPN8/RPN11